MVNSSRSLAKPSAMQGVNDKEASFLALQRRRCGYEFSRHAACLGYGMGGDVPCELLYFEVTTKHANPRSHPPPMCSLFSLRLCITRRREASRSREECG